MNSDQRNVSLILCNPLEPETHSQLHFLQPVFEQMAREYEMLEKSFFRGKREKFSLNEAAWTSLFVLALRSTQNDTLTAILCEWGAYDPSQKHHGRADAVFTYGQKNYLIEAKQYEFKCKSVTDVDSAVDYREISEQASAYKTGDELLRDCQVIALTYGWIREKKNGDEPFNAAQDYATTRASEKQTARLIYDSNGKTGVLLIAKLFE